MIFTITRTGAVRFQFIANTATAPCFTELAKHLLHDNGDHPAFPTLDGHPSTASKCPVVRQLDGITRAPVTWDRVPGVSASATG
jgi:hypothetical protein